jgi:hypothetical protein
LSDELLHERTGSKESHTRPQRPQASAKMQTGLLRIHAPPVPIPNPVIRRTKPDARGIAQRHRPLSLRTKRHGTSHKTPRHDVPEPMIVRRVQRERIGERRIFQGTRRFHEAPRRCFCTSLSVSNRWRKSHSR